MHKNLWNFQSKIVPIILAGALVLTGLFSQFSISSLQGNARVINYTGIVRGATQRLIKQELNRVPNDSLITRLDGIMEELGSEATGANNLIRLDSNEYQELLAQMQTEWLKIKQEILLFREGEAPERLYNLSESFFDLADQTVFAAEQYTEKSVQQAKNNLAWINLIFILLAALSVVSTSMQQRRQKKLQLAEEENKKKSEQISQMFQDLRAPMDEISELMYVSDIETYDVLYVNNAGRKLFDLDHKQGQKCYQVIQGLDAPCPFCTTPFLKPGENYSWEHTNPVTKRHYLLKDRLVEWEGRQARMEIAFDITKSENERIELKNMLDGEKIIVQCVQELYESQNLHETVSYVMKVIGTYLAADRVYIFDIKQDIVVNTYEWCNEGVTAQQENLQELPLNLFAKWMELLNEQECVIVDDVEKLAKQSPDIHEVLKAQDIQRLVMVPLEFNGNKNGCMGVDNPPPDRLQNAVSILQTLRYFLMLASHRAKGEEELARLSYFDTLTSFFNRNRYIQDVESLSAKNDSIGVVFVDVNGLKEVNDQYGHDAGDLILKDCARHIRRAFESGCHYRIGGDEFVVLCPGIQKEEFLNHVSTLRMGFSESADSQCRAAVGAHWSEDSRSIQNTISFADEKMYSDKRMFYRNRQSAKRYRHSNDYILHLTDQNMLQTKIDQNKFLVYFQPKVSLADRSIIGAEALVRYRLPDDTIVMPGEFIPLLEEAQTISQLDFFVFETVCAQMKRWREQGLIPLPVSINFSRCSLSQAGFPKRLMSISEKYGIEKRYLEIEITETGVNLDISGIQPLINQLRQAGFTVSIDDFGSECSNLSFFSSADFDILKIDKSLIQDIVKNRKAQAIVQAISNVCKAVHINLVVEGVEEEQQMEFLGSCGIETVQGFLFSRPISLLEFEARYLSQSEKRPGPFDSAEGNQKG